jgi:iron complex outermembrane receptor protein
MTTDKPVCKVALWSSVALFAAFAEPPEAHGEPVLEEVVVTASKREEDLQDVAISIKAFSDEDLEEMGADTFTDYARAVPSLSFAERGSNRNQIILRGLGPSVGLPTVGTYLDGVPVQVSFETVDPRLFDIERIEILRGPQGTLYGEGSLGGTINVISARPRLDRFEGKVAAEYLDIAHGGDGENFSGMVNLPLVEDKFALRLVALNRNRGGFIDFPLVGAEDANTDDAFDSRVLATWRPSEKLQITGIYYYQDATIEFDQAISPTFAAASGLGKYNSSAGFRTLWDWKTDQLTLEVDYDLGFADLVAHFGRSRRDRDLVDNLSGPAFINELNDVTSGEIRLVSKGDGPWSWIGGVFARNRESDIFADLPGIAAAFGLPAYQIGFDNEYDGYAVFGELSYAFNKAFAVRMGARVFKEDIETLSRTDFGIPGFETLATAKNDFSNFSPKLAFEYRPNDTTLIYTSGARGFRSGGNNVDVTADPNYVPTFDQDSVTAFELGLKKSLSAGALILNVAAFHNDWDDIQITGIPGNSSLGFTTNGGKAHSTGIEFDFAWTPVEGLEIGLGGALMEAETDEAFLGGVKGSRLENVAEETFNASVQYEFPLAARLRGSVRGDYSHRGDSFGGIPNSPTNRAAPYGVSNIRFGLQAGSFDASLYVDNVFDELGSSFSFNDMLGISDRVFIIQPRTVGVRLQYAFGSGR